MAVTVTALGEFATIGDIEVLGVDLPGLSPSRVTPSRWR
jgi:hypothetical protein